MAKPELTSALLQAAYNNFFKYKSDNSGYKHRYSSWDLCYNHFQKLINKKRKPNKNDIESAALHLGFYLASWGMLRGSSKLLKAGLDKFKKISHLLLIDLKDEKDIDSQFSKIRDCLENNGISPSQTLITKIMLGVYSSAPALDVNFNRAVAEFCDLEPGQKIISKKIDSILETKIDNSVTSLKEFIEKNLETKQLPLAKILDAVFFRIGIFLKRKERYRIYKESKSPSKHSE